jgi:glutamine synthetase
VHTREVIYNVAAKHGLRATFAPRIYMNSTGSAAHTHISVHSGRVKKDIQLSSVEKSFLAGLMAHLPSLPALTLPIPASYKRVNDGVWSGGTYVCWGTENREAPVRLTNSASPSSRRFEMRYIDGTANPYLVLAGILGAGYYLGIRSNLELTVSDCPGPKTAAQMSEDERRALGISKRMPLSWSEARERFDSDAELSEVLGTEFREKYLSVNKVRFFLNLSSMKLFGIL